MTSRPFSPAAFRDAARSLAAISQRLYGHGWSPATSSNYSMRLNEDYCAITVSGRDKGRLTEADVMAVDLEGRPATEGRPSAETGLHTQIYRRYPGTGAVLHTHSVASTALTMHWPENSLLTLKGYELLKAMEGIDTHATELAIPVLENTQDIDALARQVDDMMGRSEMPAAYLIRGHGLYTWASNIDYCYRQIEALEFLFQVELQRKQIGDV